ncbi:MAG TPA: MBL fold metallo-hydrolase [Candidatus Saccharimonadales bacterium]|nr:MBL fold metallo-hydrolase [Candidatus Saccharimonadales bacterium]
MKVTVLGSGMTATYPGLEFRYPSSHLVQAGDHNILLDISVGTLPQLAKLGLSPTDIDTICISHYHADHFAMEPFLQALYVLLRERPDAQPTGLRICGPPDIESRVRDGYCLKGWNFDNDLLQYARIMFVPYQDDQMFDIGEDLHITPFITPHFKLEAYALRLETEGQVLAYSGDSTDSPALETAAKQADLFLCEASQDVGTGPNEGHIDPRTAGDVAKRAEAKRVVLVHYSGNDTADAMTTDVQASGYTGQVNIAQDLSTYE